jgi:hypothetical protein
VRGHELGDPKGSLKEHPAGWVLKFTCDRDRAGDELVCVAIAAMAQRRVGGGGEQVGEDVEVAGLLQQGGGPVDALAKLSCVGRSERSRLRSHRQRPVVAGHARPVKRLVGERGGGLGAVRELVRGPGSEDIRSQRHWSGTGSMPSSSTKTERARR